MTTPAEDSTPLSPGSQGSDEALDALNVLHKHPHGLRGAVLARMTGIEEAAMAACLRGLRERGRVVSTGHGQGTLWRTRQHALAAGVADAETSEA